MLYQAYQAHSDVLTPIRLMAHAARGILSQPWPLISDNPLVRGAAAACELVSRAGISHSRPDFRITSTTLNGRTVAVGEDPVLRRPRGGRSSSVASLLSVG